MNTQLPQTTDETSVGNETFVVSNDETILDDTDELRTVVDEESDVRWCRHAMERYYQRTPSTAVTHDRAWRDGISVQYALPYFRSSKTNRFPQEVRMYGHENCKSVMVVERNRVVTTLLVRLVEDSAIKQYLNALWDLHDQRGLQKNTEMYGESPTRIEQINVRRNHSSNIE